MMLDIPYQRVWDFPASQSRFRGHHQFHHCNIIFFGRTPFSGPGIFFGNVDNPTSEAGKAAARTRIFCKTSASVSRTNFFAKAWTDQLRSSLGAASIEGGSSHLGTMDIPKNIWIFPAFLQNHWEKCRNVPQLFTQATRLTLSRLRFARNIQVLWIKS